ncbi:hypothetical protein [Mesorhizobium captivum]|uniref:hypothetical protein n=1 Tax=Mesorhizobium captivum TaxID=3072319 RepID=UPI002A24595C|nr:hypothetical protein [Mesorhizobium sp. VK3C]MDX8449418.1 hypothetical protein [Mesorhizobium sp. VK3C]
MDYTEVDEQRPAETMEVEARTWADAERAVQEHLQKSKRSVGHTVLCAVGGWEALKAQWEAQWEAQREARQSAEETRRRAREERDRKLRERREELAKGFQVHVVQASGLKDAFAKAADQRIWRGDRTYNFKEFRADRVRIVVAGEVLLDADFALWQIAMGTFTNSEGKPFDSVFTNFGLEKACSAAVAGGWAQVT